MYTCHSLSATESPQVLSTSRVSCLHWLRSSLGGLGLGTCQNLQSATTKHNTAHTHTTLGHTFEALRPHFSVTSHTHTHTHTHTHACTHTHTHTHTQPAYIAGTPKYFNTMQVTVGSQNDHACCGADLIPT